MFEANRKAPRIPKGRRRMPAYKLESVNNNKKKVRPTLRAQIVISHPDRRAMARTFPL